MHQEITWKDKKYKEHLEKKHTDKRFQTSKIAMLVILNQILGRTFLTAWRLYMN